MERFSETTDFLMRIWKIIRPAWHHRIAWLIIALGAGMISEFIWYPFVQSYFEQHGYVIPELNDKVTGLFVMVIGCTYHLIAIKINQTNSDSKKPIYSDIDIAIIEKLRAKVEPVSFTKFGVCNRKSSLSTQELQEIGDLVIHLDKVRDFLENDESKFQSKRLQEAREYILSNSNSVIDRIDSDLQFVFDEEVDSLSGSLATIYAVKG